MRRDPANVFPPINQLQRAPDHLEELSRRHSLVPHALAPNLGGARLVAGLWVLIRIYVAGRNSLI
jgi:hypothetical protein